MDNFAGNQSFDSDEAFSFQKEHDAVLKDFTKENPPFQSSELTVITEGISANLKIITIEGLTFTLDWTVQNGL